jgi:hypothetical protein
MDEIAGHLYLDPSTWDLEHHMKKEQDYVDRLGRGRLIHLHHANSKCSVTKNHWMLQPGQPPVKINVIDKGK